MSIETVANSAYELNNCYCVRIPTKKRYINPMVLFNGRPVRLTDIDVTVNENI
jgi:hypothetical protein